MSRNTLVAASIAAGVLVFATIAGASPITNGGFEDGATVGIPPVADPNGWSLFNTGAPDGSWYVSQKIITPVSGRGWFGPADKEFAAVSDTGDPGAHVLYRMIQVGKNSKLQMFVYYKNRTSTFCSPADLFDLGVCNQQYRIDIVDDTDPTSTNVLKTLFQTKSSSPKSMNPKHMTFKLGSISGTVMLRFTETDTEAQLNASVDNVVINNG